MTDPLDLDALKRALAWPTPHYSIPMVHDLIAELEATRLERDDAVHDRDIYRGQAEYQKARAERAKTTCEAYNLEAELSGAAAFKAEARIAAALAAYDLEDAFTAADAMYRALTGDVDAS